MTVEAARGRSGLADKSKRAAWILLLAILSAGALWADVADHAIVRLRRAKASASSTLKEKGRPASYYAAEKAVDGDVKTSWCADAKGTAIKGQTLTLDFPPVAADRLMFLGGVGASGKLFRANNRVSKAAVEVTDKDGVVETYTYAGSGTCYDVRDEVLAADESKGKRPCLFDAYGEAQTPTVVFPKYLCVKRVVLTILEVEPGSVYDDTCIAEVGLVAPGGPDPMPEEFVSFARSCK